jgi:adenylate cyclase
MLLQQSRRQEALGEARLAVAMDPHDGDSLATLAEVLTIVGLPLEALTELERVKGTDLEHSRLYHRALGRALFAIGRFSEAAVALEGAVALQPDDKSALELLTATYGHLGRMDEASSSVAALNELMRRHWRNRALTYRLDMAEFDSAMQLP